MIWLWLGVLAWSGIHALPALAPTFRTSLIDRLGAKGYQIGFALLIVGSVLLMILGWRSAVADIVYEPPGFGRHLAMLLMLVAFVLFGLSHGKSNLKRFIPHPQLTAMSVWAIAHLLANGDSRSVVLFGVLGIWALIEMLLIGRRDGVPIPPEPRPWSAEAKPVIIGVVMYVIFVFLHPYLFGVSPIGV
ncbi:MAG: NnrU family protein [Geminicoccaceae bacterium]